MTTRTGWIAVIILITVTWQLIVPAIIHILHRITSHSIVSYR